MGDEELVGILRAVVDAAVLYLPFAVHRLGQTRAAADIAMVIVVAFEVRLLVGDVMADLRLIDAAGRR